MGVRKSHYFGATTSQAKKVKRWKSMTMVYTLGEQKKTIADLVAKGYIVKFSPLRRGAHILVDLKRWIELHPEKAHKYGVVL